MTRPDDDLYKLIRWTSGGSYRHRLMVLAALSTAEVGLRVLSPWPMKAAVDYVFGDTPVPVWTPRLLGRSTGADPASGHRVDLLVGIIVAGVLLQLAHQLVLMIHTRVFATTGQQMVHDLRSRMFSHLQRLGLNDLATRTSGDSVYRLETDAGCLEHLVLRGIFPLVFSGITLVVMFAVLIRIDPLLTVVSLAVVPLMFAALKLHTRRTLPHAEQVKTLESRVVERLYESFAAIRLVKSYAREPFEEARFEDVSTEAMRARLTLSRHESQFAAAIGGLTVLGTSLVLLVGGVQVLHGRISLGTLLVVLAYLGFVYGPLSGIANTTGALQHAIASGRRVRKTLALLPEAADAPGSLAADDICGEVTFEHVSFAYPDGRPVLTDVSFRAAPGETIALVGMSGAGKTTLVSLVSRFFEPSSGRILIDGVDVRRYGLRSLRRRIAVVLQDAVLMAGTIRENLRYGRLSATYADMEAAARAADAHGFIQDLARGYDTKVGEGGLGLSGGQKQRLSMARAFLKNAPILVLDEPTAALDTISEQAVFAALQRLREGRTTFVIAHRLSTARGADRILVLDGGHIVAQGTHDELQQLSPLYRRLCAQLERPHLAATAAA